MRQNGTIACKDEAAGVRSSGFHKHLLQRPGVVMSMCIIRADCPVDNIFFDKSNFQPQSRMAQWRTSTQPPKSLWRDDGGFLLCTTTDSQG